MTAQPATTALEIRPAEDGDLPATYRVLQAVGFRDPHLPGTHAFIHGSPRGRVVVAEHRGRIICAGSALSLGATGWITTLGIEPVWSRRGIAKRVAVALEDWLVGSGVETILILGIKTLDGLARSMRWEPEAHYALMRLMPASGPRPDGIRALTAADSAAVRALDRAATGEDRGFLLDICLPLGGLVAETDGELAGFHLNWPWGPGPTVARQPDAGLRLIEAIRRGAREDIWTFVPEGNERAVRAIGSRETRQRSVRLRKGPPVPWRPEMLFGGFNLYWG